MNKVTNRQAVCDILMTAALNDRNIVVLCSDSRGSASLKPFAEQYPEQFVEVGIAEQNLVSIAAGLAACGKKVIAASPASFLSTRSYEQVKIDVAYSRTNVILLGISGGISYGALGMTHHSAQDIAALAALPDMRVYLPSDRFQTAKLMEALLRDEKPAYVRVSRSAAEDIYDENLDFELDRSHILSEGPDATIVACGEMVPYAAKAAEILKEAGIRAGVIDMYCLKPLDEKAVLKAARRSRLIATAEEHSPYGGLGSLVAQALSAHCPKKLLAIALPDGHIIAGENKEVFAHYGMDAEGIAARVKQALTGV
ncbi:MAG: transketolase family protein [Clostridiales bacterium]|jgi:transketolase|nr:transketolase family protein [Clostridiales bacterium]